MEDVAFRRIEIQPGWISKVSSRIRAEAPTSKEWLASIGTALLIVLAFPDFNLTTLAWFAFVPLLLVVARRPSGIRGFVLGWISGTLFFYVSCFWLTYSMIHTGGLSPWIAYLLLVPPAILVGAFPALSMGGIAITIRRWGSIGVLTAPVFWSAFEWTRLQVTGQLWNAIGYSQAEAFSGLLIQSAKWGGVYLVGALIIQVNAAITFLALNRSRRGLIGFTISILSVTLALVLSIERTSPGNSNSPSYLNVVAIQPNVPMTLVKTDDELKQLFQRHLALSADGLRSVSSDHLPSLVIWPESPMNFTYASDSDFRAAVTSFVSANHTSLLFNSLEPAPNDGAYNSAVLINEEGRLIAQYDKIRLMPFGEYVPLPHWLPGASLISGLVGDFAPGKNYVLMPVAGREAGVFICIESAYPDVARKFAEEGADVLINISNDGYLGPSAVMRQHLANAVFRAVENARPLLSVTNTGVTAFIRPDGVVQDQTTGFQTAVRTWRVGKAGNEKTFYTRHGDLFVEVAVVAMALIVIITLLAGKRSSNRIGWKRI